MNKFDYNCYIGRWPFSKSRKAEFDELRKIHEKNGITHGFVSSLESILYNDPMEGNLELAKILKNTSYEPVPSLNPLLPNIERDFRIAGESFEYKAVRIYPTIHGYDYDAPELEELMNIAKDFGRAVFIHTTFGDVRMDYLLKQTAASIDKLPQLMKKHNDLLTVLFNLRINEIIQLEDIFSTPGNIYFDMAELKHSMFAIEDLAKHGLDERIIFGSFYPMFDFSGAYIHFEGSKQIAKDKILSNNIFERGNE